MKDRCKGIDQFGQTIHLTYKGDDSYKTLFGAFVSFILILILLAFFIFKAYNMFKYIDPQITKVSLIRDMNDGFIYQPQNYGYDFGFGLDSTFNSSIGYFTVKQLGYYSTNQAGSNGVVVRWKSSRGLEIAECGSKNLNYPN